MSAYSFSDLDVAFQHDAQKKVARKPPETQLERIRIISVYHDDLSEVIWRQIVVADYGQYQCGVAGSGVNQTLLVRSAGHFQDHLDYVILS